jgi:hypothetical protein
MRYKNESNMLLPKMSALVVAVLFGGSIPAYADEQSEQLMKQRIEQLESQVTKLQAMVEQVVEAKKGPAIDGDADEQQELGRIRLKVEALENSRESSGFKDLKISGMIDPTYIYNRARSSGGFNFLGNFNQDTNGTGNANYTYYNSYFGQSRLQFDKELEGGTKFKLTLVANKSTNTGSILQEASMSVPLNGDTNSRFIAGQFPDWSGYEYYFSDQQKLISHNLLFDFAIPSFYTGAGVDITRGNLEMKGMIANMNTSNRGDHNKGQVLVYRGDYTINEYSGFGFSGVEGEYAGGGDSNPSKWLDMIGVDGFYTRGALTWNGHAVYGQWKHSAYNGGKAQWAGFSTLLAYKFVPTLEGVARLDYLQNDKNGGGTVATGVLSQPDPLNGFGPDQAGAAAFAADPTFNVKGANRSALSLGLDYAFNPNVMFKAEFRFDHANIPVFEYVKSGEFKSDNQMFGLSTVLSF